MEREQFVAHARLEEYHWWFTARREILRAMVHAIAPPDTRVALADIGCGTGGNVAAFDAEYHVLGIDPSPDAIEMARARYPTVAFVQGDNPRLATDHLAHGGILMMTDVLEHVVDDQTLFNRAVQAMPAGGTLLITVPNDPSLWSGHDEIFGHSRRYTLRTLRLLWGDAPVKERLVSPFNSRLHPLIATIRRLRRHQPVKPGGDLGLSAGIFNEPLRNIFAGEASALVAALDSGEAPFQRGVSLMAVLQKL